MFRPRFGWPNTLSPHDRGLLIEDVWPPLSWGPERLPEIERKLRDVPWAQALWQRLLAEGEQVLATPPELPLEPIGWRHDFYSPATGEHLVFDPHDPRRFVDPWDQSVHADEPRHRAWILLAHERTYRLMRSVACLARVTGDARYAAWAVQGLEQAVAMWGRTDLRNDQRGALYFQPLYDAQVLALIANTAALLAGTDAYPDTLRQRVRHTIFEAGIPHQIAFLERRGAHNMGCYVAAALAWAGIACERPDWVALAYEHPRGGFHAQLEHGFARDAAGRPDGWWGEGTQFYHLYSAGPLLALYALAAAGIPGAAPAATPAVRDLLTRMLLVTAETADEQLRLPAIGDLGAPRVLKLSLYRPLYEMGAGLLEREALLPILARMDAAGVPRGGLAALAFGPDEIAAAPHRPGSVHHPAVGLVVLRDGEIQVHLRASRSFGGHDHADKLAIGLTGYGVPIVADLGTPGYGLREPTRYCRSPFSHATLLIDEAAEQRVHTAELHVDLGQGWAAARIEDAHTGAHCERRLRLAAPCLWIEDRAASEAPRRFSWLLHPYGSLSVAVAGRPVPLDLPPFPAEGVFAAFTHRRRWTSDTPVCLDWRVSEAVWLRAWITADTPFEVIVGQTPGNPMPDRRSTAVVRAAGREVTFRAVLEVHRGAPELEAFPEEGFPLPAPASAPA